MNKISVKFFLKRLSRAIRKGILNVILALIYYIGIGITVLLYFLFKKKHKARSLKTTYWDDVEKRNLSMEDCSRQI